MTEQALRAYETRMLGPDHAAEHAEARKAARRAAARPPASKAAPAGAAGARVRAAAVAPTAGGQWAAPYQLPVFAIHSALLPTGKVMMFAFALGTKNYENATVTTAQAWLWDPALGTSANAFRRVDPPVDPVTRQPVDIWCGGNSFLADGRLLVAGGNRGSTNGGWTWKGLEHVYTFNPFDETWTRQPDMRAGRWYPSQLRMPDGRTVIMSGMDQTGSGATNPDVEVFTPSPELNSRGSMVALSPQLDGWFGSSPPSATYYPRLHWMRSGRGLVAGMDPDDTWFFRPPGADNRLEWEDAPNSQAGHFFGTSVALPGGTQGPTQVLQTGGGFASTFTELFDEANSGAGWKIASPLKVARGHHNTVLLPDGSMATVGGGVGWGWGNGLYEVTDAHKQVELWDPVTKTWSLGAAQAEGRAYHSTALLLPDGRVWSAGDNVNGGTDTDTAEIYSPPYLFKGPRPTITSLPATVALGATFQVRTPDADVTRAVLVSPGASTHGVDMSQRHVELEVTSRGSGSVTVKAPPNGNAAPPGYYMLFLLNDKGVPSVAKFVRVT